MRGGEGKRPCPCSTAGCQVGTPRTTDVAEPVGGLREDQAAVMGQGARPASPHGSSRGRYSKREKGTWAGSRMSLGEGEDDPGRAGRRTAQTTARVMSKLDMENRSRGQSRCSERSKPAGLAARQVWVPC